MSRLPGGVANGPNDSDHIGKDAQVWERPWTLKEIRESSDSWSLAADSGLFLFLQDFSQRMLSKTHEIEKQLDGLIRDTKATDSCLHSVFNDFLMLSNTQFIENRVYDEEVEDTLPKADTMEKQPEQKTREQKEAELIPKMQEAVNYGLKVLESAFEHLDIKAGNSDSEDEEVTDRVEAILEPKDLYVERPLPYLIGSQAFMEQDDVGLGDLSSDELSVDSDRDSVIGSEDDKEAANSDEDINQVDNDVQHNIKKSTLSYDDEEEDEDEDSDIFGESDNEEDDDDETKSTCPSSFADELAARIKGETVAKPSGDRASLTSKKTSKGRKQPKPAKQEAATEEDSDDMFKPPKMDDDDDFSPFGGKSGLFSGGKGLFDDDDEGDLFSDAPKPPMSKKENSVIEDVTSTARNADSNKPGKKIPAGAVSIFPDTSIFGPGNDSDSIGSKDNEPPKQVPTIGTGFGVGRGGLFDDEDEDDFFIDKGLKKPETAGQGKHNTKNAVDLFDEDDYDTDIFSEKCSASTPTKSNMVVAEEQVKPLEKKMPAGAISMFGPGTKSLLTEGLRKRQPSTSEESEKSEENGPGSEVQKAPEQTAKTQARGLFSDDEDTQVFQPIPKSQSKPEFSSQGKSKAPLSLFDDDDEEEDLFASASKSKLKPNQTKASTPQPSKASSSLFSDDEDQWMSSSSSATKHVSKAGGMKPSGSAPSSLPSVRTSQKSTLFDEDDDDLFTPTKKSGEKKPQRVALLFEEEDDDDRGTLFGIKPTVSTNTTAQDVKPNPEPEKLEEVAVSKTPAEDQPREQAKPAAKTPEMPLPLPESSGSKKKPVGGVSLFGGIEILANKQTSSPLDEADSGRLLSKDSPPSNVKEEKKEEKVKSTAVSLFDEEEEEDEQDWNDPIFTPRQPTARNTLKPTENRPQAKSTGVFQDEELLFSQTQQKDNDPDVDLFATSGNTTMSGSKLMSAKTAAPSLFEDDDEDDLFSSIKPKPLPPKVPEKPSNSNDRAQPTSTESISVIQKPAPSPVKRKEPSSRIGKLQANLMINPAVLLPDAARNIPGAVSVLPDIDPSSSSGVSSSSLSPSPAITSLGPRTDNGSALSFDTPVQVSTLESAQKRRAKGSSHRRPQSRAARHQAVQRSMLGREENFSADTPVFNTTTGLVSAPDKLGQIAANAAPLNSTPITTLPISLPSQPSLMEISVQQSNLTLPVTTNTGKQDSAKDTSNTKVPSTVEDDFFSSDGLFGGTSATNTPPTTNSGATAKKLPSSKSTLKRDHDKSNHPSIFDDNSDDFFQTERTSSSAKKTSSFLEEDDDDDDDDLFKISNNSTSTTVKKEAKISSSFSKPDIFKDDVATVPNISKQIKEKPTDASLFDDNIDIFADLTDTLKPKLKSKGKGEAKSIFDDDMDDIFASAVVKPVTKPQPQAKKMPPSQESSTKMDSNTIFDDPLNVLGGK